MGLLAYAYAYPPMHFYLPTMHTPKQPLESSLSLSLTGFKRHSRVAYGVFVGLPKTPLLLIRHQNEAHQSRPRLADKSQLSTQGF